MENIRNINPVRVEKTQIINLERGKLPPQALDLEAAVLGAMLIDRKGADECLMVLKSSDVFYKDAHKHIFEAVLDLYNDNRPVDMLTVAAKLKSKGVLEAAGGDYYIIELTQKISSSAHIEYHSYILLQNYIKRWVITSSSKIVSTAYDEGSDSLELLEEWARALDVVTEMSLQGKRAASYPDLLDKVQERIEFLSHKNPEEVTGVRTGFKKLDLFSGGYQGGDLIIVGARPGMGKTSYVLATTVVNAKHSVPVGFISAEMSAMQLTARTVAIDTDFHLSQILKTGFEKPEYFTSFSKHKHRMRNYPIHIDDTPSPDIRHVIATARQWKRQHNIGLLIVDYIQLCADATKVSKSGNREQEIASISRKLKALAKELDIPVIALSQVSRECESRSDKRPKLSDLRESGAIEQDADIVQFLYRDEYYGFPVSEEMLAVDANAEVIWAKFRGGGVGTRGLWWQGDKTKFMDPEDHLAIVEEDNARLAAHANRPLPTPTAQEAFGNVNTNPPEGDIPF